MSEDGYVATRVTFEDEEGWLRTVFTQARASVTVQLPDDATDEDTAAALYLINDLPELIRQATFEIKLRSMMREMETGTDE